VRRCRSSYKRDQRYCRKRKSWGCNCISFFGVDLVLLGGSPRAVHWWLDKPVLEILISKQHRGGIGTPLFPLFRLLSLVLLRSTRRIFAARSTVPIKGTDAGRDSRDLTPVSPQNHSADVSPQRAALPMPCSQSSRTSSRVIKILQSS
jgi:hypothetical protein